MRLYTKSGYDCTQRFGEPCSALAAVPARSCIIDREVIAFDPLGLLDFHALHFRTADDEDIAAGPRGRSRAAKDIADIRTAVATTAEIGGRGDAQQPVEVKAFPFRI